METSIGSHTCRSDLADYGVVDTLAALHDSTFILAMDIKDLVPVLNMPVSGLEVTPQEARQAAELLAEAGA